MVTGSDRRERVCPRDGELLVVTGEIRPVRGHGHAAVWKCLNLCCGWRGRLADAAVRPCPCGNPAPNHTPSAHCASLGRRSLWPAAVVSAALLELAAFVAYKLAS